MRIRTAGLVAVVLIGAATFPTYASAQTDVSVIRVIVEYRDTTADIYVVNPDGTLGKNLTHTPDGRGSWIPSFSRDCRRIVFASNRDDGGGAAIYVMDADGSNIQQLTKRGGRDWDYMPIFSPDGSRILYIATVNRKRNIWVMDADGSNQRRFSDTPGESWYEWRNPWSPDGTKLVFHSTWDTGATVSYQPEYKLGGTDLFVADPDGSNVRRLTQVRDTTEANAEAVWSPDGTRILFASIRDGGEWRQWIMDADGSNERQLTHAEGLDTTRSFEWSPDGAKVLFESNRDGNWEVWVMGADGSNQRQLTHTSQEIQNYAGGWSPDGRQIVFSSSRDVEGLSDVYVMDADGGNVRRLTTAADDGGWSRTVGWSAFGILFWSTPDGSAEKGKRFVMDADGTNIRPYPMGHDAVCPWP